MNISFFILNTEVTSGSEGLSRLFHSLGAMVAQGLGTMEILMLNMQFKVPTGPAAAPIRVRDPPFKRV